MTTMGKLLSLAVAGVVTFSGSLLADETPITAGLNAPLIGSSGGAEVHWGPIVTQTSMSLSGNTVANFPQKIAGTYIERQGSGTDHCMSGTTAQSGPGPTAFEWFCNQNPAPPAPQVDFEFYKALAESQGNACGGQSCYNAGTNVSFSGINDPVCTVNGRTKVWFFNGDVSFSGSTYFCGILLSRRSVKFSGGGSGDITMTPPSSAHLQYQVKAPNASAGNTSLQDEYPGDAGLTAVKPYRFINGGGGYNGNPVTFNGYIYATTGYEAVGHTLVVGAVQFGQGAASTSGGGTIFFKSQTIVTVPPVVTENTVRDPIISPPGGNYTAPISVSITPVTSGSVIYYTTDGTTPTETPAQLYTAPFTVSSNLTVKAKAFKSGMLPSGVAQETYTFTLPPVSSQISFNVASSVVSEGVGSAAIAVKRTGDTSLSQSVSFATADGTAIAPNDYISASGQLTFAPGETNKSFSVTVIDDSVVESNESVNLSLVAPTNGATISQGSAVLTISDNDTTTPVGSEISFNVGSLSASEGSGGVTVTVKRTGDLSQVQTVDFETDDGTAIAPGDYTSNSGVLTFAANDATKTFSVTIIDDTLVEGNETVHLHLLNSTNGAVVNQGSAVLTITDNDSVTPPVTNNIASIVITPASATKNPGETQQYTAQAYNAQNQLINGVTFEWNITGTQNTITLAGLATAGNAGGSFTVTASSGAVSGQATFIITAPTPPNPPTASAPVIHSISPDAGPAGFNQDFTMLVRGANFVAGSVVHWNAAPRSTTFLSASELLAVIRRQDVATVGVAQVTVVNADPAATSNSVPFTIFTPGSVPGQPPFLVVDPRANPNPTFGKTTALYVLGGTDSPGGESNLRYTWLAVAPNPTSFTISHNGGAATNAAKNATATFTMAGTYRVKVRVTDVSTGMSVDSGILVIEVRSKSTRVLISPRSATVEVGKPFPFTAKVYDQFDREMGASINWAATGGSGVAINSGVLTATDFVRTIRVSAESDGATDSVEATMVAAGAGAGNLDNAIAYPVPFKATSGLPGVTFGNLIPGAKIRLFTTDGHLVHTLVSDTGSDVLWKLDNASGNRISSGVYFYRIEGNGQRKDGKVVIIQ